MLGSAIVYCGLILLTGGSALLVKPLGWLRVPTRRRAASVMLAGALVVALGFGLPAPESRAERVSTRLDEFAPAWQFREFHSLHIAAPPERVFEALGRVRADEIRLFRTLTWIRRGGRPLPGTILDAGAREPLIDVAVRGGFVRLAEDAPHELVLGTAVMVPPGWHGPLTAETFRAPLPPGFALAAMNFLVTADGASGSRVTTETRVFASGPAARRKFARYWRLIYPGSALIRRQWLRAIERRATAG